ncbi:MAG: hypothetical protein FJ291_27825 [Planctomycetes bacterium]|nr:hypothetical protein [Planctomycetota bacterium]
MRRELAVANSSTVNRYNMVFTIGALESGLDQSWCFGIPSFISHDYHRPIGWARGLALHFEPGLVRLVGMWFHPETEEEKSELGELILAAMDRMLVQHVLPHLDDLTPRLEEHLSGNQSPVFLDCAAMHDEGLAVRRFPEVFSQADDDGLVPYPSLALRAPGVFEKNGLVLFAHPFFRRSLSRLNGLNTPFLNVLDGVQRSLDVDVRIALDPDVIGLASTFKQHHELEYWWGPKFNNDLSAMPPGVTRHEADDVLRVFHGVARTEFRWYRQEQNRVFEAEEVRDLPSFGVGAQQYGCRYVHSIVMPSAGDPMHTDGAVRMYNEEAMIERLDTDLRQAHRQTAYTKLWRVDGGIPVSTWKRLLTHYYRDNRLVGEYLGGREEAASRALPTPARQPVQTLRDYVPGDMRQGEGIRLALSYHELATGQAHERIIMTFDTLTLGDRTYRYVEAEVLDLAKILRASGEVLEIPEGLSLVAFEDRVTNLPLILHLGEHSVETASRTQAAILRLCRRWVELGHDRLLSFTLGVQYEDREAWFSIAGHVVDVSEWLSGDAARLPRAVTDLGQWSETANVAMGRGGKVASDNPPLSALLQESGMLLFRRSFVDRDHIEGVFLDEDAGEPRVGLAIPEGEHPLRELVRSGQLEMSFALLLQSSRCSRCGSPYERCPCSKYLEDDVCQIMERTELLGFFWTNRRVRLPLCGSTGKSVDSEGGGRPPHGP